MSDTSENTNNANFASNSSPTIANSAIIQRWREDALEAKREISRSAELQDNQANRPVYNSSLELIDDYLRRTSGWTQKIYRKKYSDAWKAHINSQPDILRAESSSSLSIGGQITRGMRKSLEDRFIHYLSRVKDSNEPVDKQLYRLDDIIQTSEFFSNLMEETRPQPPVVHGQSSDGEVNGLYDTVSPKEAFLDYFYSQAPISVGIRSLADEYYLVYSHFEESEEREKERSSAVRCLNSIFRLL